MAKNETPKVTRNIPYRYVCEHCGTQTEWKTAHLTGDTEEAINNTILPTAVKEAQKGNYFELNNIEGKCPHCRGRQSWELGEAKAWMRRSPLMGLGVGAMIGGVGAFVSVFLFGLLGALILFLALSIICMIGAFIFGLVQYISIKSSMKKTSRRHTPEVVWQSDQRQLGAQQSQPSSLCVPASQTTSVPAPLPAPTPQAAYFQQRLPQRYPAPSSEPVIVAAPAQPVVVAAPAHSASKDMPGQALQAQAQFAPPSGRPQRVVVATQAQCVTSAVQPRHPSQPRHTAHTTTPAVAYASATQVYTCLQCGTPVMGAGAFCIKCGSQIA